MCFVRGIFYTVDDAVEIREIDTYMGQNDITWRGVSDSLVKRKRKPE